MVEVKTFLGCFYHIFVRMITKVWSTKVVPMNVIIVVSRISGATYHNSFKAHILCSLKPCLHLNANERRGRMYVTFVHWSALVEAANRPYINILYANSLWSTDSWWIAFGCSLNVRRTAECCLPHLGNMSTLNEDFVFACHVRIQFVFRCKANLRHVQKVLDHLRMGNTSRVMDDFVNEGSPTPTKNMASTKNIFISFRDPSSKFFVPTFGICAASLWCLELKCGNRLRWRRRWC